LTEIPQKLDKAFIKNMNLSTAEADYRLSNGTLQNAFGKSFGVKTEKSYLFKF